jgi:hypothetical protein
MITRVGSMDQCNTLLEGKVRWMQRKQKKKRKRRVYTAAELAEVWDRWERGKPSDGIAPGV